MENITNDITDVLFTNALNETLEPDVIEPEPFVLDTTKFSLTQYTNATGVHEGECGAELRMGDIIMKCKSVFTQGGVERFHHLTVINIVTGVCITDVISSGNFPRLAAYTKDSGIHSDIQERMALAVKCHANSNHYLVNM